MILTAENIILVGSALLFFSIIAGKTGYRFGVPTAMFFMLVGILAGAENVGGISFTDPRIAQFIGIVALNFILFTGGLTTSWSETKPIFWQGISLATLGVLLTAVFIGIFVYLIMPDFGFIEALLLGSIVSSTDAAAVFSVMRAKNLGLKNNLKPMLEFESGSNDPMAYFLTITCISLITGKISGFGETIPLFIMQLILGLGFGFVWGHFAKYVMNNIKLDYEGLYFVLVIAIMFFSFSLAELIGGNGFLSVYITGLTFGNLNFIHKSTVKRAFDGIAWLMQIVLFLTLGLLLIPADLLVLMGIGNLIAFFVIIFARPVSVFLSLSFIKLKKMSIKDRTFVSWVGLKGAVPIVFATYPMIAELEHSQIIFNLVFFISSISLIAQGTTIPMVAKLLKLDCPLESDEGILDKFVDDEKTMMKEVKITPDSYAYQKALHELDLPKSVIIALISRNKKFIVPDGATILQENDRIKILAEDKESLETALIKLI